ncbi:hypothetical protein N7714_04385 [Pseudomonas aeruginosa]|uniref:hypothetical protein n=1 Tax=Pseudomonas aeruginosa TaxID=287 RepID=UPI001F4A6D6E|nr:hypothetical protein [Pseudomonas aeruginosa]MCO3935638.1 hypothetical protein [Pseudomonas aeruginosa]MDG9800986.1 hypothetical protein [Pseudomonas aeruginosa]MDG9906108.1 hypothetical protein [Pseudomonas aeruginosa]MDH0001675.1 hypothetical protein [Pseudomonas aeruginosa]MDH0009281.1 hypothetical protein [Pseudomonas aeruginosa]
MFYYYGRKKQIAKRYPSPNYQMIVEPFAGAAAYSFHADNWKKEVVLIEKDKRVADIWDWLINEATPNEIKALPDLKPGEKSSEFLHIIHAATKQAFKYKTIKVTPVLARNWEISKRVISESLDKISHWKIFCGDFTTAPDVEATWFIDPPYKGEPGMGYYHSSALLDYEELARWAKARKGEVIFCEGLHGDYLPFKPLLDLKGVAGKVSKEMIYYQAEVEKGQLEMFG